MSNKSIGLVGALAIAIFFVTGSALVPILPVVYAES